MPARKRLRSGRAKAGLAKHRVKGKAPARGGQRLGLEYKFHDAEVSAKTLSATWAGGETDPATANCLNGIAQGDTESTRDGRKYTMTAVQIRGSVEGITLSNQADAVPGENIRLLLVLDTQSNGTQIVAEEVMTAGGTQDVFGFRNLKFSERFVVLKDWTFDIDWITVGTDGTNTQTIGAQRKYFNFYKRLNIPVVTTDTGATIADISGNSLHMIGVASAGSQMILNYQSRVRFVG